MKDYKEPVPQNKKKSVKEKTVKEAIDEAEEELTKLGFEEDEKETPLADTSIDNINNRANSIPTAPMLPMPRLRTSDSSTSSQNGKANTVKSQSPVNNLRVSSSSEASLGERSKNHKTLSSVFIAPDNNTVRSNSKVESSNIVAGSNTDFVVNGLNVQD